MASTDSNDTSDIFWPGYVDAVTNLAINLLFVIAVMSIVVVATTMQVAQMDPKDKRPFASAAFKTMNADQTALSKSQADSGLTDHGVELARNALDKALDEKESAEKLAAEKAALAKALADKGAAEKVVGADKAALAKALADKAAAEKLAAEKAAALEKAITDKSSVANAGAGVSPTLDKFETVTATQKQVTSQKANQLQPISGGVVVAFSDDAVDLTEAEAADLVNKMTNFGALKGSSWKIQVISPKGFSEAVRLAYYRVNAVRNVLLKQGIPSSSIDMQVMETERAGANNARVLVKVNK